MSDELNFYVIGMLLERISKISIPIAGLGFIIEILATASEDG